MTTPADFARGNAQLAEVQEAAEQLFDNLALRSELGSPMHHINSVRSGSDGDLWYELSGGEAPGRIRLTHRVSVDIDQLLVRALGLGPDLGDEVELVWNKGAYQGAHNYNQGEFAEPSYDFLEATLKVLKELEAEWQLDPVVKLMLRANQLMTIIRLPVFFFDENCIGSMWEVPPATEEPHYQYSGEGGGYIEAKQNGILGLVKLKVVSPDGAVFIHDTSGQNPEREDPEAISWGNRAIRAQLERASFR